MTSPATPPRCARCGHPHISYQSGNKEFGVMVCEIISCECKAFVSPEEAAPTATTPPIAYWCMACPEVFYDADSSNLHHDATGHNQTWRPARAFGAPREEAPRCDWIREQCDEFQGRCLLAFGHTGAHSYAPRREEAAAPTTQAINFCASCLHHHNWSLDGREVANLCMLSRCTCQKFVRAGSGAASPAPRDETDETEPCAECGEDRDFWWHGDVHPSLERDAEKAHAFVSSPAPTTPPTESERVCQHCGHDGFIYKFPGEPTCSNCRRRHDGTTVRAALPAAIPQEAPTPDFSTRTFTGNTADREALLIFMVETLRAACGYDRTDATLATWFRIGYLMEVADVMEETNDALAALRAEHERTRQALARLRDCEKAGDAATFANMGLEVAHWLFGGGSTEALYERVEALGDLMQPVTARTEST